MCSTQKSNGCKISNDPHAPTLSYTYSDCKVKLNKAQVDDLVQFGDTERENQREEPKGLTRKWVAGFMLCYHSDRLTYIQS